MTFYQIIAEGLFFAFIILVILGSLITIRAKILMQTVLGLAVALLGVAGIYFYLGSMLNMELLQRILMYLRSSRDYQTTCASVHIGDT